MLLVVNENLSINVDQIEVCAFDVESGLATLSMIKKDEKIHLDEKNSIDLKRSILGSVRQIEQAKEMVVESSDKPN